MIEKIGKYTLTAKKTTDNYLWASRSFYNRHNDQSTHSKI